MKKRVLFEDTHDYLEMHKSLTIGNWSANCSGRTFIVNNNGIKLAAREDENLEKIIFDLDKKTVSVKVKNPTLPTKVPRIVDLSNAIDFFEELRKDIEMILMVKGTFKSVTPNADRTVFEISDIDKMKNEQSNQ